MFFPRVITQPSKLFQPGMLELILVFLYTCRRRDVCYHPWQAGGRAGGVPHSLSGAYLQDYVSYSYETSWVDRSHQGGVQCTGTITLALELLPFVYFHT